MKHTHTHTIKKKGCHKAKFHQIHECLKCSIKYKHTLKHKVLSSQERQISVIEHASLNQDVRNQDGALLGYIPENLFSLMIVNGNDNCFTRIVLAKISLNGIHANCVRGVKWCLTKCEIPRPCPLINKLMHNN